jgi:phosphatidylglycerophosphatase A
VQRLAVVLATVGPVGYLPVAPGTAGSLAALPLLPGLAMVRDRSTIVYAVAVLALVAAAIWAAGRAEDTLGGSDHSAIVVDEVAGMVAAGLLLPGTWAAAVLGFVLFRLFDVVKPYPAGLVDARVEGGLGVVGDDLIAGLYAGLVGRVILGLL